MYSPSRAACPTTETTEIPPTSGVFRAVNLTPSLPPGDGSTPPAGIPAPRASSLSLQPVSPSSTPPCLAAKGEPANTNSDHLDEVVRAFFPGWDARSPRFSSSRPPPPSARGRAPAAELRP